MTVSVTLPWPPAALTPHAKGHWAPKARATAAYKEAAFYAAKEAGVPRRVTEPVLRFTFHPPSRRGDPHNLPGRVKAAIDGIAMAMQVDDRGFQCVFPSRFAEPVKGGRVIVEVIEQ